MPAPEVQNVQKVQEVLEAAKPIYTSFNALKSKRFALTFALLGVLLSVAFSALDTNWELARDCLWYCMWLVSVYVVGQSVTDSVQMLAMARGAIKADVKDVEE